MAELSEFSVFPVLNRRSAISEISSLSPLHKMADFELPELFALPKMADLKLPEPSASPKMANIEPFNLAVRPFEYLVFLFLLLPRFLLPPALLGFQYQSGFLLGQLHLGFLFGWLHPGTLVLPWFSSPLSLPQGRFGVSSHLEFCFCLSWRVWKPLLSWGVLSWLVNHDPFMRACLH